MVIIIILTKQEPTARHTRNNISHLNQINRAPTEFKGRTLSSPPDMFLIKCSETSLIL